MPKAGKYNALVVYAARQGFPLETCKFILKVNGQSFGEVQPINYDVFFFKVEFDGV